MASLIVYSPAGQQTYVPIERFPFVIGRQPGCDLVLADQRISRNHARIVEDDGVFYIEDLGSRHGITVNDKRIQRQPLIAGDSIEFGIESSYQLQFVAESKTSPEGLQKLREILAIARSLETTVTPQQILDSVVDTALKLTRAERGFLFLRRGGALEMRAARDTFGQQLQEACLRVPRRLIEDALDHREAFAINFDEQKEIDPGQTVLTLELQSSIFVPLPRADGVLYLDSRADQADLARGNRELLETLALEAASVLESARRYEEERSRQRLEEELALARSIQESLLPRELPTTGWLRAAGSSTPSRQVGGDFFDVHPIGKDCWAISMADVSGKGAGAALLASLLQGALLMMGDAVEEFFARLNGFLIERTRNEKYATLFYGRLDSSGQLRYANAGHCPPVVISRDGSRTELEATGIPLGLAETASHYVKNFVLAKGDKLIVCSDGFTDNVNVDGVYNGLEKLSASAAHSALLSRQRKTETDDDVTLMVVEFNPD